MDFTEDEWFVVTDALAVYGSQALYESDRKNCLRLRDRIFVEALGLTPTDNHGEGAENA